MTYYRVKPKHHRTITFPYGMVYTMYHVQIKAWWTLWMWKSHMAFDTYEQADEYIDERMQVGVAESG